ncbi:MAG: Clp protease N-terminal domain-containing protein [Streptosporangiaceae bacterium]
MFERFSAQARRTVEDAVADSHRLRAGRTGCQHLLIALARPGTGPAADALNTAGADQDRLRRLAERDTAPLDGDALAVLGIDLDAIRRSAEEAFGAGALDRPSRPTARGPARGRLTGNARKAIELALRQAQRNRDRVLSPGHLLIGLIDQGDNSALRLLAAAGLDPGELRAEVVRTMAAAA